MEPILELATRVTTHVWFLRGLWPADTQLQDVSLVQWRAAAEPREFSGLQNLLDLVGEEMPGGAWSSGEWLWSYGPPGQESPAAETVPFSIWHPLRWLAARRRARLRRQVLQEMATVWHRLQEAKERALDTLIERIGVLRQLEILYVPLEGQATRDQLYERLVERLLRMGLSNRVLLGAAFVPKGFFIEEHIYECAGRSRKSGVANWRAPLSFDPATRSVSDAATGTDFARLWMDLHQHQNRVGRLQILLDPDSFRSLCVELGAAVPFSVVMHDELDEIARGRVARLGWTPSPSDVLNRQAAGIGDADTTVQRQAFQANLFGLALSGGGIRSATFALGLMQGMADRNILPYFDVLSTVSGGGYIGSWLIAWIKRKGGIEEVQKSLRGHGTPHACADAHAPLADELTPDPFSNVARNVDPSSDHVRPIRLLRQYARYLAPQAGLFSADTWAILTTWLRNTFLNLLILAAGLGALLLTPRIGAFLLIHRDFLGAETATGFAFAAAAILFLSGCLVIGLRNLRTFGPYFKRPKQAGDFARGDSGAMVTVTVVPVIFVGAYFLIAFFWYARDISLSPWIPVVACEIVVSFGLWILKSTSEKLAPSHFAPPQTVVTWDRPAIASVVATLLSGGLAYGLYAIVDIFAQNTERGVWIVASLGVVLALTLIGVTMVVFVGLMGGSLSDEQREWWSRMAALLGIAVGAWLIVCCVSYFAPFGIVKLGLAATAAGGAWGLVTGWGSKLAFSPKSGRGGDAGEQGPINAFILAMAPSVFVLGLLSLVSFGLFVAVGVLVPRFPHAPVFYGPAVQELCCSQTPFTLQRLLDHYWSLLYGGSVIPLALFLLLMLAALGLAWGIDINQFSMHNFYKNRLVRCYLGASRIRLHRQPNRFTGFDPEDDIRLVRFQYKDFSQPRDMVTDCQPSYVGPYPIINTALNVTQGADLGLQQRKAESFIFTPLWSGFDYSRRQASVPKIVMGQYGFRRTREFGEPSRWGASLGTAMAISGAAFNSNSGFHTSPSLAFLLTIFGVRLGWWAGNPRLSRWTDPSPSLGLGCLARELTANTSTDSEFLLLSDGGHFENMALYELIRRRCRYIIISDAEEDEKFKLEGIGGAIRKCRIDFGVSINLDIDSLRPIGDPATSHLHYCVGTIQYPGEDECAKLIYIKSSVTGDEPLDILEFRKRHPEFPHTSTANQFFDESHFESYRTLGQHVAQTIFLHDAPSLRGLTAETMTLAVDKIFCDVEVEWRERLKSVPKGKSGEKDN